MGVCLDVPGVPADQVVDYSDLDLLLLMVAHLDLERLVGVLLAGVDAVIRLAPLADQVEGVAEIEAHLLARGGVVDDIFAHELAGAPRGEPADLPPVPRPRDPGTRRTL